MRLFLFFHCTIAKQFWQEVETYWNTKTNNAIVLSLKDVIIGNKNWTKLLNYILLLGKVHIHYAKISNSKPNFPAFSITLKRVHQIEKKIYSKKNLQN